jgi:hypothetical protein
MLSPRSSSMESRCSTRDACCLPELWFRRTVQPVKAAPLMVLRRHQAELRDSFGRFLSHEDDNCDMGPALARHTNSVLPFAAIVGES